jgi:hypothetical protein
MPLLAEKPPVRTDAACWAWAEEQDLPGSEIDRLSGRLGAQTHDLRFRTKAELPSTQVEGSARRAFWCIPVVTRAGPLWGLLLLRALAWPIDAQPRPRVARLAYRQAPRPSIPNPRRLIFKVITRIGDSSNLAQRRITYYRHLEVGDSARVAEIKTGSEFRALAKRQSTKRRQSR